MNKAKWLKMAKKCMTLMLVMCCLCAPAAGGWFTKDEPKVPAQSETYKKGTALASEGRHEEARQVFEMGAEKSDPWCMFELGGYYYRGDGGLQEDSSRAVELMTRAAEMNIPDACAFMGFAYSLGPLTGNIVPQDAEKANAMLTKAAELGHPELSYMLGCAYLEGTDTISKDTKKGIELIKKAAELGNSEAVAFLSKNGIK